LPDEISSMWTRILASAIFDSIMNIYSKECAVLKPRSHRPLPRRQFKWWNDKKCPFESRNIPQIPESRNLHGMSSLVCCSSRDILSTTDTFSTTAPYLWSVIAVKTKSGLVRKQHIISLFLVPVHV